MARANGKPGSQIPSSEYRLLFDTHEIRLRSQGGENVREGFSTASEFEANKGAVFRDTAYLIMEEERNDWKPKTRGNSLLANEKLLAEREGFEPLSPDG